MAAKQKSKKKVLLKHRIKKLHKDPRVKRRLPLIFLLIGIILGFVLYGMRAPGVHPRTLVWAAESDINIPDGLADYLRGQTNCKDESGKPRSGGVSLWSVYKVSQEKFAKVAYGCSYDLSFYRMAVLENGEWQLLDQKTYLATSFLPRCGELDKYKIDKSIEPFCLDDGGSSRENAILAE